MSGTVVRAIQVAIVAIATVFLVWQFIAIDQNSHSASDTLRPWIIEAIVTIAVAGVAIALVRRLGADRRER